MYFEVERHFSWVDLDSIQFVIQFGRGVSCIVGSQCGLDGGYEVGSKRMCAYGSCDMTSVVLCRKCDLLPGCHNGNRLDGRSVCCSLLCYDRSRNKSDIGRPALVVEVGRLGCQ